MLHAVLRRIPANVPGERYTDFQQEVYLLRLLVCLVCLLDLGFGRPRRVVSKTVPNQFRALSLDKQKLTGLLGSRVRANSEGFLENVSLSQLLQPDAHVTDTHVTDTTSPPREFAGMFLDAAADAFEYNHDLQLRSQMDKVADALASFSKTGLPGPEVKLTPDNLRDARAALLGLLAYYRVTNETGAFATAQSIGTVLIKLLSSEANGEGLPQELLTVPQLGLIEPFVRLYRLSGDRKYLDFCTALAKTDVPPEITATTSDSLIASHLYAVSGLADLYEVTGDATYLRPVISFWKRLLASRLSVTGALLPTDKENVIDTSSSAAWLQVTFKLLRITGEAGYGDQLERTVFNQVLAAQDGRTGNISPEVPLNGAKLFASKLSAANGRSLLAEAKAIALLPQLVWGRYDNGIAINLYTPGRAFFTLQKHGLVQIYSEGAFPQTGQIQLHVEPSVKSAQFPLRLRVPSWASEFDVTVADLHLRGKAGDVVIIDREWRSGDTVRVSIVLPLRTHHGFNLTREEDSGDLVLQRGPQVLALGQTLNADLPDLRAAALRPLSTGRYQISNYEDKLPQSFFGDQVYKANGEINGKAEDLLLVPYADALNYRIGLR